jgi:hypothetical protein
MHNLEGLREEYQRAGIGVLLHQLLEKIVWSTVRQYPAAEYSPYQAWDRMACEDVLNDWVVERLLGRGDLQVILASVAALAQLRVALTTSLRQHLTNGRRRSITANLFKRIQEMLREDSTFRAVTPNIRGGNQRWTLRSAESATASSATGPELLRIASDLSDDQLEVVRYGPFSQKLSPILRKGKLREFLLHLLEHSGGSLTLSTILAVMRDRFSLWPEQHEDLDESLPAPASGPTDEITNADKGKSVVARLDNEAAGLVAAYLRAGGDWSAAASASGNQPQRLRSVVHQTFGMIVDCSESPEEARAILAVVEALLLSPDN